MQRSIRLRTIIDAVRAPGGARVTDLADATGVSPMTIRRDLEELEAQGVLRRVHGGAVSAASRGEHIPYSVRLESFTEDKRAIARACADLVPDGSSVIVDVGTTCAAVARELAGRDLTVLPLSMHAATALGRRPGVRLVTPGGRLEPTELCWVGARAVRDIAAFRADIAILGVCAWDPVKGLTSRGSDDAEAKQAVITSAVRTVAVATPDKIGSSATFAVCPTSAIDTLITTTLAPDIATHLELEGVQVIKVVPTRQAAAPNSRPPVSTSRETLP